MKKGCFNNSVRIILEYRMYMKKCRFEYWVFSCKFKYFNFLVKFYSINY